MTQIQNSFAAGALFAKASRPQNAVYSGLLAVVSYYASGGRFFSLVSLSLFVLFILLYALAALYNNLQDITTDRLNKRPDNPFVKTRVPTWQLIGFTIGISLCVAVCLSALQLPGSLILTFIALGVIVTYSAPGIHLKSRGVLGILALGIFYSFLPILIGFTQSKTFSSDLLFTCGVVYLASLSGLLAKDYKDEAGDRQSGVYTVLVRHGKATVQKIALIFLLAGIIAQIFIIALYDIPIWTVGVLVAYGGLIYTHHKNNGKLPHGYVRLSQICLLVIACVNLS